MKNKKTWNIGVKKTRFNEMSNPILKFHYQKYKQDLLR